MDYVIDASKDITEKDVSGNQMETNTGVLVVLYAFSGKVTFRFRETTRALMFAQNSLISDATVRSNFVSAAIPQFPSFRVAVQIPFRRFTEQISSTLRSSGFKGFSSFWAPCSNDPAAPFGHRNNR